MKALVLCSGGDAPGMNYCVYSLVKSAKKFDFYGAIAGFKGLIENNFVMLSKKECEKYKNFSGAFIKTSRCPEFKTKKGVETAVKNIKNNGFDCVIVLGGDGTYKGCVELAKKGVNVIFIPATVDRDLNYETYSIGFLSAVHICSQYIVKVMNSFSSLDRTGVFEVMGRHNSSICKTVARAINADCYICSENIKDFDVKQIDPTKPHQVIVLQENLLNLNDFCENLEKHLKSEVRGCVIGYLQRGIDPTKQEKQICEVFAKVAIKLILKNQFNHAISLNDNSIKIVDLI